MGMGFGERERARTSRGPGFLDDADPDEVSSTARREAARQLGLSAPVIISWRYSASTRFSTTKSPKLSGYSRGSSCS